MYSLSLCCVKQQASLMASTAARLSTAWSRNLTCWWSANRESPWRATSGTTHTPWSSMHAVSSALASEDGATSFKYPSRKWSLKVVVMGLTWPWARGCHGVGTAAVIFQQSEAYCWPHPDVCYTDVFLISWPLNGVGLFARCCIWGRVACPKNTMYPGHFKIASPLKFAYQ